MTTELFTRQGDAHTGRVGEDDKGKPFFTRVRKCGRCGGLGGGERWRHTGWTCFECGGSGTGRTETVKLYTREQLDKMNASRDKRVAKKMAVAAERAAIAKAEADARREAFQATHGALLTRAEPFAERSTFIADVVAKAWRNASLTEGQEIALRNAVDRIEASDQQRAASRHIGTVGERLPFRVTVERIASFEGQWGTTHIVTMRDAESGAALVSKGRFHAERGEQLAIVATVKEHSEYRGEAQTVVQRVSVAA